MAVAKKPVGFGSCASIQRDAETPFIPTRDRLLLGAVPRGRFFMEPGAKPTAGNDKVIPPQDSCRAECRRVRTLVRGDDEQLAQTARALARYQAPLGPALCA